MQQQQQPPLTQQDFQSLLSCLQNALNQNPEVQKQAEAYIQSLDSRPGFSSALAEIVSNREADHSARYLASVHLKNSINRNWKKRVAHAGISDEEKAHLRAKLAQLIPQEDNQIAVQVALTYAKVARFDFPAAWPGLFADLLGRLGPGQQPLLTRRVYLILHHVLKELSSKRLVADQAHFAQVTEQLLPPVWAAWCSDTQSLLQGLPGAVEGGQGGPAHAPLLQTCERWMLLLKVLRRLLLHGFPPDARTRAPVGAVHTVGPHMLAALQGLLAARRPGAPRSHLAAMAERGRLKLLRTLGQVQEAHPWSFHAAGVLLPTMDLCVRQLLEAAHAPGSSSNSASGGGGGGGSSGERLLVQCCGLLAAVMACKAYKGQAGALDPGSGQPRDNTAFKAAAAEVRGALEAFWAAAAEGAAAQGGGGGGGSSRLTSLVGCLVTRHMLLTRSDLEAWRDAPEEWAHSAAHASLAVGGGGSWGEAGLGAAAEQLLLVLLQAYREALGPAVVSLLPPAQAAAPPGVAAEQLPGERQCGVPLQVLAKEAVYGALTAGAYELHDYLDWRAWLAGSLMQELSDACPAARPLRRRIALLVAANVERIPAEDAIRPPLYGALLALLSEPDPAVALAAVAALTALLGDYHFEEAPFAPHLPACVGGLLRLLGGSAELDTQKQAFGLLNLAIERCGEALRPHAAELAGALPALWAAAEGQSLLRIQILEALQRLVNLAGPASPSLHHLVLPLLGYSLDLRHAEVSEGLLEDGLALWLVALRNAPACTAPLPPATAASALAAAFGPGGAAAAGLPAGDSAAAAGHPSQPPPGSVLQGAGALLESLLAPFGALAGVVASSTEHLPMAMALLSSAGLLAGPQLFAGHVGAAVAGVLQAVVGHVSERGHLLALPCLELLLRAGAPGGAAAGALQPVLAALVGMVVGGKESSLVVSAALPVFARLLLSHPAAFGAACGAAAADPGVAAAVAAAGPGREPLPQGLSPGETVLHRLLEAWAEGADCLATPPARRLCGLGLAAALALPSPVPLALAELLLPPVTAAWCETEGGGGGGDGLPPSSYDYSGGGGGGGWGGDGLEATAGPALDSEDAEGECTRRAQLREADPAPALPVSAALRAGLAAAAALHGGGAVEAAVARLAPGLAASVRAACGQAGQQQQG